MKKIILYIATSIDGYIAKVDGSVDWLDDVPNPNQLDYGYYDFYDTIDTTFMGNATYQQLMGWDVEFPYPHTTNYVFSRSPHDNTEHVKFVWENIPEFIRKLKAENGKNIWLIGGARLNTTLLKHDFIDEMIITTLPIVLGTGIPLFYGAKKDQIFQLVGQNTFEKGVIQTTYRK